MSSAELGQPAVVGLETSVLVVEVRMVTEHHADGGIDDLGGDAIARLIRHPRLGIPAAPVELLEARPEHLQTIGPLTRRGDQAHGDGLGQPVDHEQVATRRIVDEAGGAIAPGPVDAIDVRARRFGDV